MVRLRMGQRRGRARAYERELPKLYLREELPHLSAPLAKQPTWQTPDLVSFVDTTRRAASIHGDRDGDGAGDQEAGDDGADGGDGAGVARELAATELAAWVPEPGQ